MAEDQEKTTKYRLRYRKKVSNNESTTSTPSIVIDKVDDLVPPELRAPSRHSPVTPTRDDVALYETNGLDHTASQCHNRKQELSKYREQHSKAVDIKNTTLEILNRHQSESTIIKRSDDDKANKLSQSEVMYALFQEHNAKVKHSARVMLPTNTPNDTYPVGFNPSGAPVEVLLPSTKKWEEHLRRLLGGQRVADHEQGISCLRQACRESYRELLVNHTEETSNTDISERLWMSWYKEIEPLLAKWRQITNQPSSTIDSGGSRELNQVRESITPLLAASTDFYNRLLHSLSSSKRAANIHAIHMALVALGDLARYGQNIVPKHSRNWRHAETQYRLALEHNPSNGKVYNQLALLALHQHRLLDATFLYCRSLACATPFCSRENLMSTLTTTKAPKSPSKTTESKQHCSTLLLHCYSRLFTGIDVARLEMDITTALDSLRSLLHAKPPPTDLQSFLLHMTVVAIFSVHNCQVPIGGSIALGQDLFFHSEFPSWSEHDNVQWALHLTFLLATALIEVSSKTPDQNILIFLPALNVFLDWLRVHPWFLRWKHPTVVAFRGALSDLLPLLWDRIPPNERTSDNIWQKNQVPLWEDKEIRGFLLLDKVIRCGYSRQISDAEDNSVSLRIARVFGFLSFASSIGWMSQYVHQSKCLLHTGLSVQIDTTCPQCSNSIPLDARQCVFCGYEMVSEENIERPNESLPSHTQSSKAMSVRGILTGVNLQKPKPKSAKHQQRAVRYKRHSSVDFTASLESDWKCLIVVDAANVAMRHGLNKKFSCRGIRLAFDYFLARSHKVIAFLPDYLLKYETVGVQKRMANIGFDVSPSKVPDDVTLLQSMVLEGLVIATPPQDYDDSYCIQYAGTHDGCLVTNDMFRDHVENIKSNAQRNAMRDWLKSHRISFTWVGDEFFPNPDFRFPPKRAVDELLGATYE
ncbi:hypothetical protein LEN26_000406 [Aphanomyces euteiches]|nr:hypothetical protein LEN26_000406 [Aphanomyces euteiches]